MDQVEFAKFQLGSEYPSELTNWPTKQIPDVIFRFNGIYVELHQKSLAIERQTYSVLELVGDVGGLYDGLNLILSFFIAPLGRFALNKKLFSAMFSHA